MDTKKISLCILISLLVSFSIFIITLNYHFNKPQITEIEKEFYKTHQNNTQKIYVVGSSQVLAINATRIEESLQNTSQSYEVYNLGKPGDFPKNRIDSLQYIIDSKPALVLYGIGFRELQQIPVGGFGTLIINQHHQTNLSLIAPQQIIDYFLSALGFYELDFEFLLDPKFKTLELIKQFQQQNIPTSNEEIIRFDKIPFYEEDISKINSDMISKLDESIQPCPDHLSIEQDKFRDVNTVSLKQIVTKLQENGIKVVIFTTPQHKNCIDNLPKKNLEDFTNLLINIEKIHNTKVVFLHDSYRDSGMWVDNNHLTFQNSYPYTDDIIKIIKMELGL